MNAIIEQVAKVMTVGMRFEAIKGTSRYGTTTPQIKISAPKAGRDGYHPMAAAAYAVASQVHMAMAGQPSANFAVGVEVLSGNLAYVTLELVKDDRNSIDAAIEFLNKVLR
jgi:hypothetical protein